MYIAYVRVSTEEHNEERQVEALKPHGIEKWFIEKGGKCPEISTDFALKQAHWPRMVSSTPIDCLENRSRGDCKLSMIGKTDRPDSDLCAPNCALLRRLALLTGCAMRCPSQANWLSTVLRCQHGFCTEAELLHHRLHAGDVTEMARQATSRYTASLLSAR